MDTKAYVSTLHSRGSFHWTENSEESENYAAFCEVNLLPCRVVSVACTVLFCRTICQRYHLSHFIFIKTNFDHDNNYARRIAHVQREQKKMSSHSYFEIILSIIGRMETIEYTSWNCRGWKRDFKMTLVPLCTGNLHEHSI